MHKDKTMAIISQGRAVDTTTIHIDYALITRGYKGNIQEIITALHPDTILLSHDVTRPKRTTYHTTHHPIRDL
jgi:hypothetical protein